MQAYEPTFFNTGDPFASFGITGSLVGWTALGMGQKVLSGGALNVPFIGKNIVKAGTFQLSSGAAKSTLRSRMSGTFNFLRHPVKTTSAAIPTVSWGATGGRALNPTVGKMLGGVHLGARLLGAGMSLSFGSMLGDMVGGGASAMASFGAQQRRMMITSPMESVGFMDSQQAATMRQQSVMAIRQSQMALGSWFGREASAVHR